MRFLAVLGISCDLHLFSAEYMLQIIGAGATATTDQDWHAVWRESKESRQLDHEIEEIIEKGQKKPPLAETHNGQFATSWLYQTFQLIKRGFSRANRDPNYLVRLEPHMVPYISLTSSSERK